VSVEGGFHRHHLWIDDVDLVAVAAPNLVVNLHHAPVYTKQCFKFFALLEQNLIRINPHIAFNASVEKPINTKITSNLYNSLLITAMKSSKKNGERRSKTINLIEL
jgi:hypothetical protein